MPWYGSTTPTERPTMLGYLSVPIEDDLDDTTDADQDAHWRDEIR